MTRRAQHTAFQSHAPFKCAEILKEGNLSSKVDPSKIDHGRVNRNTALKNFTEIPKGSNAKDSDPVMCCHVTPHISAASKEISELLLTFSCLNTGTTPMI